MKIIWLRRAGRSVQQSVTYVARDNIPAARKLLVTLRKAPEILASHPYMGRAGRVENTRELVIPGTSYIIVYRMRDHTIEILHVLHMAQEWPDNFYE